jgi:NHLM bacteriocin system ABC transporter peptidase/ATP-binding protein
MTTTSIPASPTAGAAPVPPPPPPAAAGPRRRRVRTPTVLQLEATECGAASLGMVLGYFGKIVSLEELRAACGISRDGSKAANVMRAARSYGLIPHGFRREPEDLPGMDLPMIVFWRFNHFVVVDGFGRGKVHLNDPATGPRTVSDAEFSESFTGIVLTFEQGPGFQRGGRRPGLTAALLRRLGRTQAGLAFAVLAGLLLVVPGIGVPALTRAFVNSFLVGQRTEWLPAIVIGLGVAAFMQLVVSSLQQVTLLRMQTKLSLRMSAETIDHLLRLPAGFFSQRAPGDLAFRASLNDQIAQTLSGQLSQAVLGLFTASFYAVFMGIYDLPLLGVVALVAAANVGFLKLGARARKDLSSRVNRSLSGMSGAVAGGIALIESVKASGGEDDLFGKWAGKLSDLVEARQRFNLVGIDLAAGPAFLSSVSSAAVLGIGALQVMNGTISLGTLIAFQALMGGFLAPVSLLVGLGGTIQSMAGNLNRIDDILDTPQAPELTGQRPAAAAISPDGDRPLRGELELRGVTFGYSPLDPPLIDGLDLHLQPGQRVALVGASGSGKSTVSRLVSGLYEPWGGEILIDGLPRFAHRRAVLADGIALVDQEINLFDGTVRDNITLWDDGVPDTDIVAALSDACLADEILRRPGGIASLVDEGGRNFSGGQRQRLEIARSLSRGPALLVLDEATSALDPLTEQAIDLALRRRGCTCLIVAHRLSTIRDSDEIVVLDKGKVVERGTHESLLERHGFYERLIES